MTAPSSIDGASGPIVDFLNDVVAAAIEQRASDVHIEPQEKFVRIRFRIDGKLVIFRQLPRELLVPLIARLKIVSQLPLDEHRKPLDGKWYYRTGGEDQVCYDVRISIIPFLHGEGAVLRILKFLGTQADLETLGFGADVCLPMRRTIGESNGLFLAVGPTGCGKSTTIYTLLRLLNDGSRKIISIEDPVEYTLHGVSQVNVAPEQKLSFGDALRAIMRQAPNVLFVGEIRDEETANNVVQAALTGHFVFSTIHADGAAGAIARLENLGISMNLLATILRGILAQRLIRSLCKDCRSPCEIPPAMVKKFPHLSGASAFRSVGCAHCNQSGYFGRSILYEWVEMKATLSHEMRMHLRDYVVSHCQPSFIECICARIRDGIISPNDVPGILL
ncbi:MAG: GspE/PulE family protein [Puniceicoccales bacterium]|jgi:type II secretory ATPase GspE/PulE/Tfp pilus assembly ATPase PilB-like protein|nr:GspE/PulE family protein [Puniceicoccales bacterium]